MVLKTKCNNENHSFTNGKHDPICSAVEMADHITKVRLIITVFSEHLDGKYTVYLNRDFECYFGGFNDKRFINGSKAMLKELNNLVKHRHKYLLCNDDIVVYKRIRTLISTYNTILDNIKEFSENEIELILSDLVNEILEYYDIELIKSEESSSDFNSDDSFTLSSSISPSEYSLDSDDQSE